MNTIAPTSSSPYSSYINAQTATTAATTTPVSTESAASTVITLSVDRYAPFCNAYQKGNQYFWLLLTDFRSKLEWGYIKKYDAIISSDSTGKMRGGSLLSLLLVFDLMKDADPSSLFREEIRNNPCFEYHKTIPECRDLYMQLSEHDREAVRNHLVKDILGLPEEGKSQDVYKVFHAMRNLTFRLLDRYSTVSLCVRQVLEQYQALYYPAV